jgi:hypothetical protein
MGTPDEEIGRVLESPVGGILAEGRGGFLEEFRANDPL